MNEVKLSGVIAFDPYIGERVCTCKVLNEYEGKKTYVDVRMFGGSPSFSKGDNVQVVGSIAAGKVKEISPTGKWEETGRWANFVKASHIQVVGVQSPAVQPPAQPQPHSQPKPLF